jgi:serine phosphatase RsbU (regulator of sigma subunit)
VAQRSRAAAGGDPAAVGRGAQDLGVVATFTMAPDGRVNSWSTAAERLFGPPARQILGRPVRDLLDPRDRDALSSALAAITAGAAWTGALTALDANGTGQLISCRFEPLTCADTPPQVAVAASLAVPAGRQMLIDAGLRFGATLDLAETARQIIDVTVPGFADAGAVYVLERPMSGGEPAGREARGEVVARRLAAGSAQGNEPAAADSVPDGEVMVFAGGTPCARCVTTSSPVLFGGGADVLAGHASFLAVPLVARDVVAGFMLLARAPGAGPFGRHEVVLAVELAARAAVYLDNARLFSREQRTAEALQRGLLPREPAVPAGMEVAHSYLPAADHIIGGDWYDILPLSDGRTALMVGDAMGHGPEAATVMVQLRAGAHALAEAGLEPEALLHRLNRIAATLKDPAFATCVCAVLDPTSRSCVIARAGHLPPVLALPDHTTLVVDLPPGLPLGLGPTVFHAVQITLPAGATLALYTDGLVESRSRPFDEGILALRAALATPAGPLQATCDAITRTLRQHSEDDTTLILARIPAEA